MIKQAQIQWSQNTPISTEFDDFYFSTDSGLDETRYVFLENSQLRQRWATLTSNHFSICETGFGTGLNFLCAWQLWLECSHKDQHLHFISVEKFPINKKDLKKALEQWPELSDISQALLEQYPEPVPGWHTLHFNTQVQNGSVTLHLFLGDISDWLPQINAQIDAWFLDGFSPAKNPDMWNDELFLNIARLTKPLGTVATFTAASNIKRSLRAAGFTVKKTRGYGVKREMGYAIQTLSNGPRPPFYIDNKPWFENPKLKTAKPQKAIVIGAGIAGCSTAAALAKRGWQVQLLEKDNSLANGASGNRQGVLYAKLATELIPHSQFYLAGFLYSLNLLNAQLDKQHWNDCGVLQLAMNEKEIKRQQTFEKRNKLQSIIKSVTAQQASGIAGVEIKQTGLYFKNGGWVHPKAWCERLIDHKNITTEFNQDITNISQKKNDWQALNKQGNTFHANVIIVCNAEQGRSFEQLNFIETKPISGQVTQVEAPDVTLNTVLCGGSYVTPTTQGNLNFGASYRLNSSNKEIIKQEHIDNLNTLAEEFPGVSKQLKHPENISGRAAVRCTSPDYTPIAGPVCDATEFSNDFSELSKSKKWCFHKSAKFLEGLYVNIGHGSRGLSSAPICAELVASQITNEPNPLPKELSNMVNPNRFLVKALTK